MPYISFIEAIKMKPNSIIKWNIIYYKEAKELKGKINSSELKLPESSVN